MNETAILATVVTALWGITLALLAAVWALFKERISALEKDVGALQEQNTSQETMIGRLTERALAREEAHQQHREDMQAQFGRIDQAMSEINRKLDSLLRGGGMRSGTPYPTQYGQQGERK